MLTKTNYILLCSLILLLLLVCVAPLAQGYDATAALKEESSATLGTHETDLEWPSVDFTEEGPTRVRRSSKTVLNRKGKSKKREGRRKIAIATVERIVEEKLEEQLQPLNTALKIVRLDSFAEGIFRQLSSIELIQSKLLTEYGELRAAVSEVGRHTLDLGRQVAGLDERLASLDRQLPHRMDITSRLRSDFRADGSRSSGHFSDVSQTTEMLKDALVAITTKISSSERRFKDDLTLLGNRTTEALKSTQNFLDRRIAEVSIDTEQVLVSMEKMVNRSVCGGASSVSSSASDRYFRRPPTPLTSPAEGTRDDLVYLPAEERSVKPAGSLDREERQHPPLITPFSGWIRPVASVSEVQTLNRGTVTRLATEIARQMMNDGAEFHGARDCADISSRGERKNGIYTIYPASCSRRFAIRVWCELEDITGRTGGGWTVIQRRGPMADTIPSPLSSPLTSPAPVDFFKDWAEYKWGFGDLDGEYWLGNEYIHHVTQSGDYDLRVELYDWGTEVRWAQYSHFYIEDEPHNYTLHIGEYTGNAGNSLKHHQGVSFSTRDRDNDANPRGHCARTFHGAWWFTSCHESHLNGRYHRGRHKIYGDGINWLAFKGHNHSLKRSLMMIRPSDKGH